MATKRNANLVAAKKAKADEFYTQWPDIEREMNAYLEFDPDAFRGKTILLPCDDPEWSNFSKFFALHFMDFGIKKLISTSYAPQSNAGGVFYQATLFDDPQFDAELDQTRGKIFTLEPHDVSGDGRVDIDDLKWSYLDGDGDFRSDEVTALRDEADMVITNPPFSLLRPFIAWLIEGGVQFSIIGSKNAATYVETFPLVQANKLWIGRGFNRGDAYFRIPEEARTEYASGVYDPERQTVHFRNVTWLTNIDHGRRHEPMQLMTLADNVKYSKHKEVVGVGYQTYVNFDAIEVPYLDAIPSDYPGIMGVPITFLDVYNPDQFEIVGNAENMDQMAQIGVEPLGSEFVAAYKADGGTGSVSAGHRKLGLTKPRHYTAYRRILIRHRNPEPKKD